MKKPNNDWQRGPTIYCQASFFETGEHNGFNRSLDCGHPVLTMLWHMLIDQWRLTRDHRVTSPDYSSILGILARAYAEVYSESVNECVRQEQWNL